MSEKQPVRLSRRSCLAAIGAAGVGIGIGVGIRRAANSIEYPRFQIALAQYSLHRRILGKPGEEPLDALDFAKAAASLEIDSIEFVSMLWREKYLEKGSAYLKEMNQRSRDYGVTNRLIMVDREGNLGDGDAKKRTVAVQNHERWLEAAAELNCGSIRVDPKTTGKTYDEALNLMADGLYRLCEKAQAYRLNVLVENEFGFGANADWLVELIRRVNHPLAGLLPDFGNFWTSDTGFADPYVSVAKMMRRSRAVSAKSFGFANSWTKVSRGQRNGKDIELDFDRLMNIVTGSGYGGWVAIEYEGAGPEMEGIRQTKRVLERLAG